MSENNGKFCVGCGAMLPDDATFCPSCGRSVDGSANPYASSGNVSQARDTLGSTHVFILIYAVVAAVIGLITLAYGIALDQAMWDELLDMFPPEYITDLENVDVDDLKASAILEGALVLVSGLSAGASGFLVKKRTNWMVALIACTVASILSLGFGIFGIVTLVVGLLFVYRIYQNKNSFEC